MAPDAVRKVPGHGRGAEGAGRVACVAIGLSGAKAGQGTEHLGSRLCGAVGDRLVGASARCCLCHCPRCRKDTRPAHPANLFSSTARLEWRAGREKGQGCTAPGTRHAHHLGVDCGFAMPYQHGGFVVAPAGSRDTVHATVPGTHIVTGGRAPWDRDLDAIPGFASLPPADDACSSILGVGRLGLSMSNPDPSRGFAGLCEEALGSGAPRWTTLKGGA